MITRRNFLWAGSATGAGLLIGFHLGGCGGDKDGGTAKPTPAQPDVVTGPAKHFDINAWVRVGTDESVTIIVPESEMGQGILTAVAMVVAEELGCEWRRVSAEHAPVDKAKYGRQGTGGSTSIRKGIDSFRRAGALARDMLIGAAADTWGVAAQTCVAAEGVVVHENKRASFGELAAAASNREPPETATVKDPKDYTIVGQPKPRLDIPAKVDGTATFGIDVKLPGMLTAQVAHPPFGAKVKRFDGAAAKAVAGVIDVIEIPSGIAVVAEHTWAASRGRAKLDVQWEQGAWAELTSDKIRKMCKTIARKGVQARKVGDPTKALKSAAKTLKAVYEVPYLAHATMEPMNATADVRADRCEVWAGTQSPSGAKGAAAEITGLDDDKIVVNTVMLGGGFGRRSQSDYVSDAVHVSKAMGKPVKVLWTREDDMQGGWYRPMAYNELEGGVDKDGWPVAWDHRIASPSILAGFGRDVPGGVDPSSIDGAADLPYQIPHLYVSCAKPDLPVTLWWWRSVGSSQNAYVAECFFDELAALGGKDPLDARLKLVGDDARHRRVLEVVADKAGWGTELAPGRARGIAVRKSFGSYCAQVAEVSIENRKPRVHRVTVAIDPGQVINPDTIEAQMESSIVYGLSAALYGRIDIDRGRAVQTNFDTYPVMRMPEMPKVDTHIVPSGDAHGGIGEPGLPPAAPAMCNALFALTGTPIRRLPVRIA